MTAVTDALRQGYIAVRRARASAPPNDAYLKQNAPGVGKIQPDEEAKSIRLADEVL